MGVDHDAFVLLEPAPQYHVRGLAPHAGQLHQLFHRVGYLPAVSFHQCLCHPDDRSGLAAEESRTVDLLLQDLWIGVREVLCRLVFRDQRGSDHVDSCIGRLSGENRGDEPVEWASAPIENVTPSSRPRRTMRQSRSSRCGSAFTSTAMTRAAALASTCSRSIAYGSRWSSSRPVG